MRDFAVRRGTECLDLSAIFARIIVNPALAPHTLAECVRALAGSGTVIQHCNDADLNCSAITCIPHDGGLRDLIAATGRVAGGEHAAGRAYRIEVMADDATEFADDERTLAVDAHGAYSAPVYVARRSVPVATWAYSRPMPWGRKGLSVGQVAPALPFGGSECRGVALEFGAPTVILKMRLEDVPEDGMLKACSAVGGAESGFADVAAYGAASAADGASVAILEFGDLRRAPLHRSLAVLDVESRRYGGRLGAAALLSHIPLDALLDVLHSRMGLAAVRSQVLETHLSVSADRMR